MHDVCRRRSSCRWPGTADPYQPLERLWRLQRKKFSRNLGLEGGYEHLHLRPEEGEEAQNNEENQENEYIEESENDWRVFAFNNSGTGNKIEKITNTKITNDEINALISNDFVRKKIFQNLSDRWTIGRIKIFDELLENGLLNGILSYKTFCNFDNEKVFEKSVI